MLNHNRIWFLDESIVESPLMMFGMYRSECNWNNLRIREFYSTVDSLSTGLCLTGSPL